MSRTKIDVSLINIVTSPLNMGSNKITNLANGTSPTDAINLSQLTANGAVSSGTANQLAYYSVSGSTISGSSQIVTTAQGINVSDSSITPYNASTGAVDKIVQIQNTGTDTNLMTAAIQLEVGNATETYVAAVRNTANADQADLVLNVRGGGFRFEGLRVVGNTGQVTLPQGLNGTTTNNNAAVGVVGEAVRSFGQVGAASFPASAVWFNVTSISLTAGDWDVSGIVVFEAGPSAVNSSTSAALSLLSGNTTTDQVLGDNMAQGGATVANTANVTLSIPTYRYSLATTTTVYVKAQLTYSTDTGMRVDARISARRAR